MTTAALFKLLPDHRLRFIGMGLACRCGEALPSGRKGAALAARSMRAHLLRVLHADRDAKRAAIRAEWQEIADAVERDRRELVGRGLSLRQFAFACGIAPDSARAWLGRRGLEWATNKRAVTS